MIECKNCHTENPDNANFCRNCRNVLTRDKFVDAIEGIHREIDIKDSVIQSLENEISTLKQEIILTKEKSTQQIDQLRAGNKGLLDQHIKEIRTLNHRLSEAQTKLKTESASNGKKITAIILLAIFNIITAVILLSIYSEKERLITSNSEIKHTLDEQVLVKQKDSTNITELTSKLQTITTYSNAPIIIKKIEVGNEDNSNKMISGYGEKISSTNTMYLKPRINFIALKNERTKLFVKLFKNNKLCSGESSLPGYSYTSEVDITGDSELSLDGWGGKDMGYWKSGKYRFEVWYNGYCLKSLDFRIE